MDKLTFTPLGSGQEVGRSCHVLSFRGTTIMLDVGIHPGYQGEEQLPFFDHVNPADIDVLLVTHFHLDHAGALPYFTERTGFKGRIFMTHPTRAVIRLLLFDYLRLMEIQSQSQSQNKANGGENDNSSSKSPQNSVLYTEQELKSCIEKIELIDFHSVVTVGPIKFWAYNAGHVLGACLFMIEIADRHVLYTGDYSMEDDRHLMAAEIPKISPDVLICEGTYGTQVHPSREERETLFTESIGDVVRGGGRMLIPTFALGRAQELLLILDEYWQANPDLHDVPIYYASKMAGKALRVYQTYINMMNQRIRLQMDVSNPFQFQFIRNLKSINVQDFDDSGPSVVFASPGMLQSGVSRRLFDRWCTDPKNGVIIAGYAVDNTLAKDLAEEPDEVQSLEGLFQPVRCSVKYVSFSAHVDFKQNFQFIEATKPKNVILVHGQRNFLERLRGELSKKLPKGTSITAPPNAQSVELRFERRRSAKVIGKLADNNNNNNYNNNNTQRDKGFQNFKQGDTLSGVLFTKNFHSRIASPDDLGEYSPLRVGSVEQTLHVQFVGGSAGTLRLFLNEMFSNVEEESSEIIHDLGSNPTFKLHNGCLTIKMKKDAVVLSWLSSPVTDLLADAAVAILMHAQGGGASVRMSGSPCGAGSSDDGDVGETTLQPKSINEKRLRIAKQLLEEQFSDVSADIEKGTFIIRVSSNAKNEETREIESKVVICGVKIVFNDKLGCELRVRCADEKVGGNVKQCLFLLAAVTN